MGQAKEATCQRCGRTRPTAELNTEATIHHGARGLECKDRQDCGRAKRKADRKTSHGRGR